MGGEGCRDCFHTWVAVNSGKRTKNCKHIDERQITHLICARLKYDLYDLFRAVLGLLPALFLV